VLQHRIERFGGDTTGAYDFYSARVQQGDIFSRYEIALVQRLLTSKLHIRSVHEIGCGFGQLVFLLGWNGFKATGFEADRKRAKSARDLHSILSLVDPELMENVDLLEGEFPTRDARQPDAHTLVLTTNLVATRSRSQQLAVLQAMRRYSFVLSDVQRFFDLKPDIADESSVLALFAEAGLTDGKLFLDMGSGGRYYFFSNPS
jgi:SAM-dependent methyltransferase